MATFTNGTKQSAATFVNVSQNAASPNPYTKSGEGYSYDSYLTYDELNDPISGNAVLYDSIGTKAVWSNQSKS